MTQTMREYVDKLAGEGAWDAAHDQFKKTGVLSLPTFPLVVDEITVDILPGTDREVTVEQMRAEVRKAIAQVENGEAEEIVFGDSYRGEPDADADTGC